MSTRTKQSDPAAPNRKERDRQVVELLLAGDEATFVDLVRQHQGPMVRLARSFVSSQALAEEVVQETWEAVLAGLARFEGRSALKTWIFRILTNRAKTRGVREGRSIPMSNLSGTQERSEPALDPSRFKNNGSWAATPRRWEENDPEKLLMLGEVRQVIERTIDELSETQGAVINLRDVEGWSAKDVCNVLEISETNQRVLLHRARSRVRRKLETYLDGR